MASIPQLRKDINDLQAENRKLRAELEKERNKPSKVITKIVEKEVQGPAKIVYRDVERVVYRDNPKHIAMIRKLQGRK